MSSTAQSNNPTSRFRARIIELEEEESKIESPTHEFPNSNPGMGFGLYSRPNTLMSTRSSSFTLELPPPSYTEQRSASSSSSSSSTASSVTAYSPPVGTETEKSSFSSTTTSPTRASRTSPLSLATGSKPSLFNSGSSLPAPNSPTRKSVHYMLYTRKGRNQMLHQIKSFNFKIMIPLVIFVIGFLKICVLTGEETEHNVNGEVAKHAHEARFLNSWINHVITHPVRARDKAGFAEMGLRTEMYAHMLKFPKLPEFERMERALWPFVPGINQLRHWWVQHSGPQHSDKHTKGIVMSLGHKGAVFASQFISIVRDHHQNDIPIELYYYGENDLPLKYRQVLTKSFKNVRCVDLQSLGLFDADLVQLERQGFAIKPFALVATNFTEVMLADADAIMLQNPTAFFHEEGYLETGTLFFHDRDHVRKGADGIIQEFMSNQLQLRGPSARLNASEFWLKKGIFEQESGIVVVDKRRTDVFAALLFAAWQNMGEIRKKTTYRIFWGDKETFWLSFELAKFPYYFVPRYAQAIGTAVRPTALSASSDSGIGSTESPAALEAPVQFGEQGEPELELCSEHPLHFMGSNDYKEGETLRLSPSTQVGVPAWFNGGILNNKVTSDEIYLDPNIITVDGTWEFMFQEETWCMRNYTKGDFEGFQLGPQIAQIREVARAAEDSFRQKIPKEKSVKQAVLDEE